MIQALIGEDTKVLTKDEELRSYFVDKFREEMKDSRKNYPGMQNISINKPIKKNNPEMIKEAIVTKTNKN